MPGFQGTNSNKTVVQKGASMQFRLIILILKNISNKHRDRK